MRTVTKQLTNQRKPDETKLRTLPQSDSLETQEAEEYSEEQRLRDTVTKALREPARGQDRSQATTGLTGQLRTGLYVTSSRHVSHFPGAVHIRVARCLLREEALLLRREP